MEMKGPAMTTRTTTAPSPTISRGDPAAGGRAQPLVILLTSLAFLMVTLDALVVVTALPSIHAALGGGASGLQWVVNSYNLVFAAGIVTGAALGDRFGRRRMFLSGLFIFTAASAFCALAPNLDVLIIARSLQGLGAAVLTPVGLTLITEAFPRDKRGAALGVWGGVSGVGVAAGPLVGGAVTQGLDWHWVFWVNVPIGALALTGCARVLRESRGAGRHLDVPGMLLAAAALVALVDALVDAPSVGWAAPRTLALLAVFAATAVGFLAREARTAAPMIPLRLFGRRAFTAACASNLLCTAAIFSAAYVTSEYFQLALGNSPLGTGLRFLPWTATPLVVAPLAGLWTDRVGARRLAVPGLLMQAAGFAAIVVLADHRPSWPMLIAPFVIAGTGVSLALPSLPAASLGAVSATEVGIAAGVVNTVQRVGSVLGIAVITAVFDSHGTLTSPNGVTSGFRWALAASATLSVVAGLVALGIPRPAKSVVGDTGIEPVTPTVSR
jgi:EmrB/QacA subfamily drug resistance transporter